MRACYVCGTEFDTVNELREHHREMDAKVALVPDSNEEESHIELGAGRRGTPNRSRWAPRGPVKTRVFDTRR